jgi:phage repressor protein C with HTH and peptisase S24 domain
MLDLLKRLRYIAAMHPTNIIAQKLKALLVDRGISAAELARIADVRTSFIYDVLSGKSLNPSTITLARVANALAVPLHDLLGSEFKGFGNTGAKPQQAYITVPKLSVEASAGGGSEVESAEDVALEHYVFRKSWVRDALQTDPSNLRLLDIRGDSMEPTLNDGDIILVDTSKKTPSPPGIFILHDGLGLVAKRLQMVPNSQPAKLSIVSDNTQYAPYERDLSDVRIIGKVVWFAREL